MFTLTSVLVFYVTGFGIAQIPYQIKNGKNRGGFTSWENKMETLALKPINFLNYN